MSTFINRTVLAKYVKPSEGATCLVLLKYDELDNKFVIQTRLEDLKQKRGEYLINYLMMEQYLNDVIGCSQEFSLVCYILALKVVSSTADLLLNATSIDFKQMLDRMFSLEEYFVRRHFIMFQGFAMTNF